MNKLVHQAFTDTRTNVYFYMHDFLALVTVVSTIAIVLETVPTLESYERIFVTIEWVAVIIFTTEYVIRLRTNKPWHEYAFSFFGAIDLLAIVPSLLGIGNLTFLKSARIVRLIRLFRLIRLAKLRRIKSNDFDREQSILVLNVSLYLTLLLSTLLAFGILLYIVEGQTGLFESIPAAMWWTFAAFVNADARDVSLSVTGGVLYVLIKFFGLILLGALIGVTGNVLRHYLLDTRKRSSK